MKSLRPIFLIPILILCFLLTACEKTPNMTALLSYETRDCTYTLRVRDESIFETSLSTSADKDIFSFTKDALRDIRLEMSADGTAVLCCRELSFPLAQTQMLRAADWRALFHLSERNLLWQIRKETLGGITVYCCRAEGVTVYIDAASLLPLRLVSGAIEIDVLRCEPAPLP